MSVNKPALCFPRKFVVDAEASSLVSYGDGKTAKLFSGFTALKLLDNIASELTLQDRTVCETDPDTVHLIVYPYLLQSSDISFTPTHWPHRANVLQLFSYTRSTQGDEGRLYGKRSIGVGGHVDKVPAKNTLDGLLDLLSETILQELKEEIGYYEPVEPAYFRDNIYMQVKHNLGVLLQSAALKLVYDDNDAVGRQHLGIVVPITMPSIAVTKLEDSMADANMWLVHSNQAADPELTFKWDQSHTAHAVDELMSHHDWESWSEILLRDIVQNGLPFGSLQKQFR